MVRIAMSLARLLLLVSTPGCPKGGDRTEYTRELEARVSNQQATIRDLKIENERMQGELQTAKARNERDEALIANLEKRIEELLKEIREREAVLRAMYRQAEMDLDKLAGSLQAAGLGEADRSADTTTSKSMGDGITLETPADGGPAKLVIAGRVLFPSGEFELTPSGKEALLKIAKILKEQAGNSVLRIDGHTDNVKVRIPNDKGIRDNEHLSALRSYMVYKVLVGAGGLDAKRVFFAGWGESKPIADNSSEEGRKKNRRVEILILPPDGAIVKPGETK